MKVTRGEEGGSSGMVEAKRSGEISREVGNSPGGRHWSWGNGDGQKPTAMREERERILG